MMDRYSIWQIIGIYAAMAAFLIFLLLPFFEMFMASLRPLEHLFRSPYQFWSDDFSFKAYQDMWNTVPLLGRYILNSIFISTAVTLITLIFVIPASYAYARLDFPFKNISLSIFLGVNMFTGAVLLIPLYRVMATIGILNTYWAMIVPGVAFLIPTGIWLLRSYLEKIPVELEDVKAVIEHAQSVFIDVLPEIEFPAHALAFTRAFPKTRDANDTGTEASVQGYTENVLNPAIPETWQIMEAIAEEVSTLFPFATLHLGADELPEGTWSGSPEINRLKAEEGLESSYDVLGWSLHRLAAKLALKGIRCAAWEEAARGKGGGIGNNALLFSWTGQQAGIEAAKSGYDVVMSPAQHVYLDMAHSENVKDWGATWAAIVGLTDTIDWEVIPDAEIADRVIGVEGTFWSEFTTQDQEIQPMIAPRIIGVASKGWVDERLNHEVFLLSARRFCEILTKMGWCWNTTCFEG
jgi:ABC-type glycerol-3-phosphate transport system permease component